MPETSLPFTTRIWFAWACFFRVLFDGSFAARAWSARDALPPAPEAPKALEPPAPKPEAASKPEAAPPAPEKKQQKQENTKPEPPSLTPALQLLALLQREGRLIDFLEQDIEPFSDAEIGATARVIHAGCRKTLRGHVKIAAIRAEQEDTSISLPEGYNPLEVKLSGNVKGSAPYKGTLRHRGWRASDLSLPTPVAGHDPSILAPAEVEL